MIKHTSSKEAFSLLMALFVIVIMSAIAALILSMTGKVIKETSTQYRDEQSRLLARSYTEFAIMAVMAHDRTTTGTCVEKINGTVNTLKIGEANPTGTNVVNGGYIVETKIQYIGTGLPVDTSCEQLTSIAISNPEAVSPTLLIDVFVRYKDPDYLTANEADIPFITYHRRTLQKL